MNENFYQEDILSQDAELRTAVSYYASKEVRDKLAQLTNLLENYNKVVFSGMGSSHFCAFGASFLLKQHGINSQVISTGELLYYERELLDENTVLCLISQSGESAEIKHLIQLLDAKVFVIAVTNKEDSTLSKRGNVSFFMNVSEEMSVTTRTYVSSLIMVQMIAAAVCKDDLDAVYSEYDKAINGITGYLADYKEETEKITAFCQDMNVISLMGRGNALSSVRAGALFLREVAKFPAVDFDSAEFRHGPMELVQEGFYAIVMAPAGRSQKLNVGMARDIAEKGGKVILITDESGSSCGMKEDANILTILLPKVEEYASQLLQILPVQLLADALAKQKGMVAGVFRWGSKITAVE